MIKYRLSRLFFLTWATILLFSLPAFCQQDWEHERRQMVRQIEEMHTRVPAANGRKIDKQVLQAMQDVPRHLFVPEKYRSRAYHNRPLPIGYGQTISQPYIVALMTDILQLEDDDKVFELGTGSGYQAAVISHLVRGVYTKEIIPELAESARKRLQKLDFSKVKVLQGDGYYGYEKAAPFQAIIVTAAASHIPPPLVRQLAPGGKMIIPVGRPFMTQELTLVEKDENGQVSMQHILPVSFVPLTGGH